MDFNFEREVNLEDDRVRLEPLSWDHFELLIPIALANPNLHQYSSSKYDSKEALKDYFKEAFESKSRCVRYPFVILDKLNDRYAGTTSFGNVSNKDERLEIGWTWIGREFQRTGLNRHCKYQLLKFAFETLNFKRVEFKTDSRNVQSKNAIIGIGGKLEGNLRSHTIMFDGFRRDTSYFSILNREWDQIKETIFKNF